MTRDAHTRVIGYFATTSPVHVVCDGDACVVAGSEAAMRKYLKRTCNRSGGRIRIRKTRFGEIAAGLQLGGAYAFDEAAYNRLRPLADGVGVSLAPQDFSDPDPSSTGVRLVHLRTVASAPCEPGCETPESRWCLTRALGALFL